MIDLDNHPCFNAEKRLTHSRVHLPVASRCNVQCNFCDRKFDCMNESRPGVTSSLLTPRQALSYLKDVQSKLPNLSVVGIAGPGDPMANPEETLETLTLVRREFPDMLLCLATNGLALLPYVNDLAALKVGHVTITVNAVDPAVGENVYSWMRYDKRAHRGIEAASYLWDQQHQSIKALAATDVLVKINTILIPGVNETHVPEIAKVVKAAGAQVFNLMGLRPVAGTNFGHLKAPDAAMMKTAREASGEFLPQLSHCSKCRADAAGLIGEESNPEARDLLLAHAGKSSCGSTRPAAGPGAIAGKSGTAGSPAVTAAAGQTGANPGAGAASAGRAVAEKVFRPEGFRGRDVTSVPAAKAAASGASAGSLAPTATIPDLIPASINGQETEVCATTGSSCGSSDSADCATCGETLKKLANGRKPNSYARLAAEVAETETPPEAVAAAGEGKAPVAASVPAKAVASAPVVEAATGTETPARAAGINSPVSLSLEGTKIAVASYEGVLVNMHLGHAREFLIYQYRNGIWRNDEFRDAPEEGGGDERWARMCECLEGCTAVMVSGVGKRPKEVLAAAGIKVYVVEGLVNDILAAWTAMRQKGDADFDRYVRDELCTSGTACTGTGNGCG